MMVEAGVCREWLRLDPLQFGQNIIVNGCLKVNSLGAVEEPEITENYQKRTDKNIKKQNKNNKRTKTTECVRCV
jgi:hypothetical protein